MSMIDNTIAGQMPQYDASAPLVQAAKLQAADQEMQQAKFKQNQIEMGSEMRGIAPFVNTPEFPAKWAEAADRLRQRGVIDDQMHQQWANNPSPLLMKSIIAKTEDPNLSFRKEEAQREQKNQDRSYGLLARADKRAERSADRADQTPLEAMQERAAAGEAAGLEPGSPEYTSYALGQSKAAAPPDNLVEYNAAVSQGYKGSLVDFIKEKKAPLVNIDQKAEGAQGVEVGKALGKAQGADIEAGGHATQTMRQLATLDNANKAGGDSVSSGPLGELILKGKQGLNEIAGEDLTNAAPSEVIKKVGFGLATNLTKAITNRPAQMEFMKALENVPNLMMSKTGRIAMTSIMMQEKRAEQEIGKIAARHRDVPGGPVYQEVKDKYYEDHPLISPFTGKPFSPDDVDLVVNSVPGGSASSTVAPGGLTRADVEAEIKRRQAANPR
jgi:hypothetical protein